MRRTPTPSRTTVSISAGSTPRRGSTDPATVLSPPVETWTMTFAEELAKPGDLSVLALKGLSASMPN